MGPSFALYLACILGALGVYLILRPSRTRAAGSLLLHGIGAIFGLGAFAWLVVRIGESVSQTEIATRPQVFFIIFSLIALGAAVRMISSSRPIYSALFFVLVVMSSAGLFLLLEAEFLAFALIIVYAGAILITYMFVLMLAQQSPNPEEPAGRAEYDINAREPAAGAVVGFILLAVLTRMIFDGAGELPAPQTPEQAAVLAWEELATMPGRLEEFLDRDIDKEFSLLRDDSTDAPVMNIAPDGTTATVYYQLADDPTPDGIAFPLPPDALPENVQQVGMALIKRFPVSLELAGIILLMAMFGAVILARRQIELTEDDVRQAAGMRRLGHHDEEPATEEGGA